MKIIRRDIVKRAVLSLVLAGTANAWAADSVLHGLGEAVLKKDIEQSQKRSKQYWAFADTIDDDRWIGTAHNEDGVREGSCYALGMLLGFARDVERLNPRQLTIDLTMRTSDNAADARVISNELNNYAINGTNALNLTPGARAQEWNFDCLGRFGIPESDFIAVRSTFASLEYDGKTLRILGDVDVGFAQNLIDAVTANPSVTTVSLGSGGGLVGEALRAGEFIRARHLNTTLWNGCYSACPFVFMAGVKRTIWSPYPVLGFHQASKAGTPIPWSDSLYQLQAEYLRAMGVDAGYVLRQMQKSDPDHMTKVRGGSELCKAGVATWIQRSCG